MATFLSALTLVILVLANSCLTLPVLKEDLSTVSLLNNDLTTELALPRSTDEQSTNIENLSEENTRRITRTFEEFSTLESLLLSTESNKREDNETSVITIRPFDLTKNLSSEEKRQFIVRKSSTLATPEVITHGLISNKREEENTFLTTEESAKSKREFTDLLYDIVEPLLLTTEGVMNHESRTIEPSVLTTEESAKSKREFTDLLYDIVEPLLLTTERANADDVAVEPITHKQNVELDSFDEATTEHMSRVRSSPAGKYVGHLEDSNEQVEKPKKPMHRRVSSSTRPSTVEVEESSKDSTVPTAEFDQDASKTISNALSDFLILDETVEIIVTGLPERLPGNTTMETPEQAKPLNQGQKSSDIEEKESDN